jgi:hypothetical protein
MKVWWVKVQLYNQLDLIFVRRTNYLLNLIYIGVQTIQKCYRTMVLIWTKNDQKNVEQNRFNGSNNGQGLDVKQTIVILKNGKAGYKNKKTIKIRNLGVGCDHSYYCGNGWCHGKHKITYSRNMNHYLSKPIKRSVICDSERASLTVAQPYKDVFNAFFFWFSFVDFKDVSQRL